MPNDIVLVMYEKRLKKGDYKLGRVMAVHPDCKGVVRTVTVGFRKTDIREKMLPYIPKKLQEITLGVQRVAVVLPVEQQQDVGATVGSNRLESNQGEVEASSQDATQEDHGTGSVPAVVSQRQGSAIRNGLVIDEDQVVIGPGATEDVQDGSSARFGGSQGQSSVVGDRLQGLGAVVSK